MELPIFILVLSCSFGPVSPLSMRGAGAAYSQKMLYELLKSSKNLHKVALPWHKCKHLPQNSLEDTGQE